MDRQFPLTRPPVFIVGPLRSGSTMLRLVLGHHPDLNIFGEFEGAVSQARGEQWPDVVEYHQFVRLDRQMKALELEIDDALDYPSLVRSFLFQLSQRSHKPIVGASVHSRMDLLPRLWPQAKFIHILRDPRDVARSAIGMGWVGNVYEGAQYWLEPEQHWDRLCASVPETQRMTVRYEDFVEQPEKHTRQLCDFVGIDYAEKMLDIGEDTTYSYPDPKYSYQWKHKLTDREINWVESRCGKKLAERGYTLSGNPVSNPAILELLYIKVQNRLARMRGNIRRWGLLLWLQHVIAKRAGPEHWKHDVQGKIDAITVNYLK